MKKTTQFRNLITSKNLEFIMEAHNGISAKIVEEAQFKGIWASGLTISGSQAVRDSNELSFTQVLELAEYMSDATRIPIMLDGDTGYGNFNNARRLVRKLNQIDIAAVCMEDKLFPKTNSFIGHDQALADIDEFTGKIKACKDSQLDSDFCVIARTEAFISGKGLQEALKRAEAYRKAGADAILVHSKKNTVEEIEVFMKEWAGRHPIVIVPTMYFDTKPEVFEKLGISLVIWANHLLRTAIEAMQRTARELFETRFLGNIERRIPTVKEIFRLQNVDELDKAEKKYLPNKP